MLQCSWKQTTGIDCPSCGGQRAFELLIQGDFSESFLLFPALIPFILTIIFTVLHLIFKFKKGAKVIVILFSSTAGIMILSYLLKMLSHNS
ncbi:MAG: DUF2752 domain-containing protein [Bacteroidota bacterium]